jgi:hypothetical protein
MEDNIDTPHGDHVDLNAATTAIASAVIVIISISTTVVRLASHPSWQQLVARSDRYPLTVQGLQLNW